MSQAKFALGIDLGTSNCALSVCDLASDDLRMVDVIQTLAPNKSGERETVPSATYLAHDSEFPAASTTLPWGDDQATGIIGHFAREHGAQVPDRLVLSAKSWLSNTQVDPQSAVLPFMADLPDEEKISAFDASTRVAALEDALAQARSLSPPRTPARQRLENRGRPSCHHRTGLVRRNRAQTHPRSRRRRRARR